MGEFKKFLSENEEKYNAILSILDELEEGELDELGVILYTQFFDYDDDTDLSYFTKDDLIEMIKSLGSDMYDEILEFVEEETGLEEPEEMDESVSRIMKKSNMNRKKRKFMGKSFAELRKTAASRKKANRENRASRKRNYRANVQKIKSYAKSRSGAIKKGLHNVKLRRKAG